MSEELKSWPERIWLQHGFEYTPKFEIVASISDEITWCQNPMEASDVPYIRADIAAARAQPERKTEEILRQAQQWKQEAKSQRATVIGILRSLGLPERDWEAQRLALEHVAERKLMPDCCDTPAYCSASRRCTAQDSAKPERKLTDAEIRELLPEIHEGDRFADDSKFRYLGTGSGVKLYEVWGDAVLSYALKAVKAVLAAQPAEATVKQSLKVQDAQAADSVVKDSLTTAGQFNVANETPVLTLSESGKPILETMQGCTMPADYSFECINNFVHCEDPMYEDLQNLALGMASHIEALNRQLSEAQPAAATVPDAVIQRFREELDEFAFGKRLELLASEQMLKCKNPAAQAQDDGEKQ